MKFHRATRQLTAWIASLAILMSVLAPGISQTINVASGSSSIWSEICSLDGAKLVKVSGQSGQPDSNRQQSNGVHCPYCLVHGSSPAIAEVPAALVPQSDATFARPIHRYQSFLPLFSWVSAQPRAPPVNS